MSSNDSTTDFNDDGDLRDPALRRALAHAPDSEATPDPRTRDAIRKMAHNLAAAPVSAAGSAANNANAAPWWRRLLLGSGEPRSRMPWNAAFATVLVATFVTVLWHREPIPDARLDGEAQVGGAAAPAQVPVPVPAPAQPPAEAAPQASPPAAAAAPEPASPPAVAAQQAPAAAAARAEAPRDSRSKESAEASVADAVRKPAAKQSPPAPGSDRKLAETAPAQAPVPAPAAPASAPVPAPAPITPSTPPAIAAAPPALARDEQRDADMSSERRRAYSAGAPAAPAAAVAPPAAIELESRPAPSSSPAPAPALAAPPRSAIARSEVQENNNASPLAGQANADAAATGALRQPAPRAAAKAVRPSGAVSFAALDRWTSFDFARSGPSVRHARGDVEGLAALVNTVARSATSVGEPLAAPVEARLALYRGDVLIAVLEIAGDQVRWTAQPGGTAAVGTPPAPALAALRSLLPTR